MIDADKEDWYEANERVMENTSDHWKTEKSRWAAVKRRLKIKAFWEASDMRVAEAWRDLGFPLKRWMADILR